MSDSLIAINLSVLALLVAFGALYLTLRLVGYWPEESLDQPDESDPNEKGSMS